MTTFSQLVDEICQETLRPDLVENVCSNILSTILELHSDSNSGEALGFADNLYEAAVVPPDGSDTFQWPIPYPNLFHFVEAVWLDGMQKYADQRVPSTMSLNPQIAADYAAWYRSGSYLCIEGHLGDTVRIAIYQRPRGLIYYEPAQRPCMWNEQTQEYTYLPSYDVNEATRETARLLCVNWMLERYDMMLKVGARAKMYSRLGDTEKSRVDYSQYNGLRPGFVSAETAVRGSIIKR